MPPRPRTTTRDKAPGPSARSIGTPIVIVTKNGDRLTGELLDLSAYSVRLRSGTLESTIALDTIATLSFGAGGPSQRPEQAGGAVRPEFIREADTALGSFQSLAAELQSGTDYTEYGRLLADLRPSVERFIERFSTTESAIEARVVALVAGALTDYSWARTIWTLKVGPKSDGSVSESDSPSVSDVLVLYPDVRAASATGNRYSVDKLISALWKKGAEKADRARSLLRQPR